MRTDVVLGVLADSYEDLDEVLDERPDLEETLLLVETAAQWGKAIGNELRVVAPGAVQGALSGFMAGGPAGAVAGAAIGGLGARAGRGAPGTGAPSMAASNQPALQLLAALLRPEVVQALGAMSLGTAGAAAVPVAGVQVPVASFANLIATLATQAAAQHHATTAAGATPMPPTLAAAADPARRAEALLRLMADAAHDDDLGDEGADDLVEDLDALDEAMTQRDLDDLDRLEWR